MCGQDPEPVSGRLEVQRDESQAESCCPVLHRQGESACLSHCLRCQLNKGVENVYFSGPHAKYWRGGDKPTPGVLLSQSPVQ